MGVPQVVSGFSAVAAPLGLRVPHYFVVPRGHHYLVERVRPGTGLHQEVDQAPLVEEGVDADDRAGIADQGKIFKADKLPSILSKRIKNL